MRLLVLGAAGMLGHRICQLLGERFEIYGTFHNHRTNDEQYNILPAECCIDGVNAQEFSTVHSAIEEVKPNAIVNCIGIVKQRDEASQAIPSIHVNALFPHQLAELCADRGVRVIQVSTDCVFSGARGNYSEIDGPDPVDL